MINKEITFNGQIFNSYNQSNLNTPEDKAATTIQKYVRGYLARKSFLPSNLYPLYYALCKKVKNEPHSIPKAEKGTTRVYLPREMHVVLKNSGKKAGIIRFHQIQQVRRILVSQKSSHLIIPEVRSCLDGEFLVERKLPINPNSQHNMWIYVSHPQLFDEAVRELTRLFSRIYLYDVISNQKYIAGVGDFVRYDNLPLYIVEENGKKEGKIGLIDLEHIQYNPRSLDLEMLVKIILEQIPHSPISQGLDERLVKIILEYIQHSPISQDLETLVRILEHIQDSPISEGLETLVRILEHIQHNPSSQGLETLVRILEHIQDSPSSQGLETLIKIFPLHLDVIKNEASKLKMQVNEDLLESFAEKGKKYLQFNFIDHFEWLKQKGISTHNTSSHPFQVSSKRAEELTTLLEKELLKLNHGVDDLFAMRGDLHKPQKNFFTENPEKTAKELAVSILSLIISDIKAYIEEHQNNQLNKLSGQDITEGELVGLRSPIIWRPEFHKGATRLMMKNQKVKFEKNWSEESGIIVKQLIYVIMEELVKGGEIFYFDPAYCNRCFWIRY